MKLGTLLGLRLFPENVKNSEHVPEFIPEFLSTSKIKFAYSRTKVGSLRKLNFLSVKIFFIRIIDIPVYYPYSGKFFQWKKHYAFPFFSLDLVVIV